MRPEPGFPIGPKTRKMAMTSQFSDMTLSQSDFFDVALNLLSISSLVLDSWQFSFISDWPKIRKLEIPPRKF